MWFLKRRKPKHDMRLTIGTGYYSDKRKRNNAVRFADYWHKVNLKDFALGLDKTVVVVADNAEKGCSPRWSKYGYQIIKADENLGTYLQMWNYDDPALGAPNLCGWTVSWMIGAMFAYFRRTDFVYIEQDCLCAGPWFQAIKDQANKSDMKVLFGDSKQMGCEQSLFWIDRAFIPWFIGVYLQYPGEGKMLCEDKFAAIKQRYPQFVGHHFVGPGRERPIPATGPRSAQKLSREEISAFMQ